MRLYKEGERGEEGRKKIEESLLVGDKAEIVAEANLDVLEADEVRRRDEEWLARVENEDALAKRLAKEADENYAARWPLAYAAEASREAGRAWAAVEENERKLDELISDYGEGAEMVARQREYLQALELDLAEAQEKVRKYEEEARQYKSGDITAPPRPAF